MPPAIPTYDEANAQLGSVYDPQTSLIQTQISQLQPQQDAEQASLDQAKVNAFRDIGDSANAKGVLFSGFTPDQQARYIGTKYLPAVADLKTTFQNNKNTLQDKIDQLNVQRSQQAQGIVSDASSAAEKAAYDQQKLAISASKASAGSTALPSAAQVKSGIQQGLQSVIGKDGYVSPQDYAAALQDWLAAGLDRAGFNKQYKNFRNPDNGYYDYAIKQAGI